MKFAEFLNENESSYKEIINYNDAVELIKTHCKNMDFERPYWRGNRDNSYAYKVDGSKGHRQSSDTQNYYTMLIDKFAVAGQPLRSKSIICTNYPGKSYASRYADSRMGSYYAVFPYDNAKIGFVGEQDIWDINVTINGTKFSIEKWNNYFSFSNIKDTSYEDFMDTIKNIFSKDIYKLELYEKKLFEVFEGDFKNVEPFLKDAYSAESLKFKLGTSADIDNTHLSEVWIGGPCILIRNDIWRDLVINGE